MTLGWDVWVTVEPSLWSHTVATWEANPGLLTTMETLVNQGDALVVSSTGGYPDVFELPLRIVREWVEEPDSILMQLKPNGFIAGNRELLESLGDDEKVYLTMMDES